MSGISGSGNSQPPRDPNTNKVNLKRQLTDTKDSDWLKQFTDESVNKVPKLDGKADMGERIEQHRRKMSSIPAVVEGDEMDFPQSFTQKVSPNWSVAAAEDNSRDDGLALPAPVDEGAPQEQPSTSSKDEEAIKLLQDNPIRESPLRHVTGPIVVLPTIPEVTEYSADDCTLMECSSPEKSQYRAPVTVWESQFHQRSGFSSMQEPLCGGLHRINRNFEALNIMSD